MARMPEKKPGSKKPRAKKPKHDAEREVDIDKIFEEGTLIDRAIDRAIVDALRVHKLLGNSIVVWQDGKVVRIPPEKIPVRGAPSKEAIRNFFRAL